MAGHRIAPFDGIRALSIGAVVVYHAMPERLLVGWIGVDVFFVLSGFLITGLLLAELEQSGRVDVAGFYLRRAARLYPALILAVAVTLALRAPIEPWQIAVTLAYLSDVSRMLGHDLSSLFHTWSLAIEEHFYLVWPLLVVAARSRRRVLMLSVSGAVASFSAMWLMSDPWDELSFAAYNAPHARVWEILVGAVVACVQPAAVRWWRTVAVSCGALAGLLTASLAVSASGWPLKTGAMALAAVAAAVALTVAIAAGRGRWLSIWPLPQVGEISYGIYLFHMPVLFAPLPEIGRRSVDTALQMSAVVTLAWLSHRLVEKPVQQKARTWWRQRSRSGRTNAGRRLPNKVPSHGVALSSESGDLGATVARGR